MQSGILGIPLENMRDLLGDISAFITFTETNSSEEAKARVFSITQPADQKQWPLALITYKEGDWGAVRDAEGGGIGCFSISSGLTLLFEKKIKITAENVETFVSEIGEVVQGILTLSGSGDYIRINSINLEGFHADDEQKDHTLTAAFSIQWGI
jgi:hypothetical protein